MVKELAHFRKETVQKNQRRNSKPQCPHILSYGLPQDEKLLLSVVFNHKPQWGAEKTSVRKVSSALPYLHEKFQF